MQEREGQDGNSSGRGELSRAVSRKTKCFRPGLNVAFYMPNRIAELSACKMRHLNQLKATYFN